MAEGLTTDLLSDFAQNNVNWLRRATARHASLSSEDWSQLAIVCELLADLAKKHRDLVRTVLYRGIESSTLKVRLERSLAFLSDDIQAMSELQQMGERISPNVRAVVDRICNASAETKAVYKELASLLALAEVEPPPVPEGILATAEAGAFIRLDEFRKRR
jgi:hypothetical protein